MKRILLTTALALALTGTAAFAQQTQPAAPQDNTATGAPAYHHGHHHHPSPQREAAFIGQKLNLSADQTAKLEPIFANRDQQFQALRQNSQLTPDQRHEQMKAIHESTKQQLATVLSPDQIQQLKEMRHNHRGNGQWKGQPQQPAAPPSGV
jgi:periplasmic protein CpxP/Spy